MPRMLPPAAGSPRACSWGGPEAELLAFSLASKRQMADALGVALGGAIRRGDRRQERHSISAATPSSISTMTPSPMIASLVRGFMIKTSMKKARDCSRAVAAI